ncbi:hypothetical protein QBC40DRAFT_176597, partial [Triangularia verruculosa]
EELGDLYLFKKLQAIYDLLTEKGVVYGDLALYNFLYVDGRIVVLDFEFSYPLPNDITNTDTLETLKDEIQQRLGQEEPLNPGLGFSTRTRPPSPPIHSTTGAPKKKPTVMHFEDWWKSLPRP